MVTVNLGVKTQNSDVSAAVAENNAAAQAITDAAGLVGVSPADIQTTYFSVWSQPMYDEFGNPTDSVTYTVDHTLTIKLRDTAKLGGLAASLDRAGANTGARCELRPAGSTAAQDQGPRAGHGRTVRRARRDARLNRGRQPWQGQVRQHRPQRSAADVCGIRGGMGGGGGVPTARGTQTVSSGVPGLRNPVASSSPRKRTPDRTGLRKSKRAGKGMCPSLHDCPPAILPTAAEVHPTLSGGPPMIWRRSTSGTGSGLSVCDSRQITPTWTARATNCSPRTNSAWSDHSPVVRPPATSARGLVAKAKRMQVSRSRFARAPGLALMEFRLERQVLVQHPQAAGLPASAHTPGCSRCRRSRRRRS